MCSHLGRRGPSLASVLGRWAGERLTTGLNIRKEELASVNGQIKKGGVLRYKHSVEPVSGQRLRICAPCVQHPLPMVTWMISGLVEEEKEMGRRKGKRKEEEERGEEAAREKGEEQKSARRREGGRKGKEEGEAEKKRKKDEGRRWWWMTGRGKKEK